MDKLLNLKVSCLFQEYKIKMNDIEKLAIDTKQLAEEELKTLNKSDYNLNKKEFINEMIRCIRVNFNTMTNCNKIEIHSIKFNFLIKHYYIIPKIISKILSHTTKAIKRNSMLFIYLLIAPICSKRFLNKVLYLKDKHTLQNLIILNDTSSWEK